MSTLPETVAQQHSADAASRPVSGFAILNTTAMTVLFGSQLGFLSLSFDWGLAGLLHLGPAVYLALGAVTMGLAAWATGWVARQTWRYERDAPAPA